MRPPERTCIGCRQKGAKRQLIRIRRQPDGVLLADAIARGPGRGAYVCADPTCIARALNAKTLSHVFRLTRPVAPAELETLRKDLDEIAQRLRTERHE